MTYLIIYIVGFLATWIIFTITMIKGDKHSTLDEIEEKIFHSISGFFLGMIWPLAVPFLGITFLAFNKVKTLKDKNIELEQKNKELEDLKKLARQYNLPGIEQ